MCLFIASNREKGFLAFIKEVTYGTIIKPCNASGVILKDKVWYHTDVYLCQRYIDAYY